MGAGSYRCGGPSHPPNPGRTFYTRPTHRLLCNRFPGTHPFPKRAPPINDPSKLACSFAFRSSLDQSKRARVNEHRHPENTIDLVCRVPRAQGLTRLIPSILVCALGEQRKLPSPPIHYFAEPSSDRGLRFCPSPEQGRPSIFYVLFLVWAALPEIIGPPAPHRRSPLSHCARFTTQLAEVFHDPRYPGRLVFRSL